MKKISLTQGQFALVDDEDFEYLNQFKWQAQKGATTYYAVRTDYSNGKRNKSLLYMHCVILDKTDSKFKGDHIDRDGLNNQRNNLRIATVSQNNANRMSVEGSSSKFKGVSFHKVTGKWMAIVGKDGNQYNLGIFEDESSAASAYNKKALELFGEFAVLNKIDQAVLTNRIERKKTSKYKGVSWCNKSQRWVAKIMVGTKNKFLGNHKNEIDAALAYNNAVKEFSNISSV